jgi:hypothetical protein
MPGGEHLKGPINGDFESIAELREHLYQRCQNRCKTRAHAKKLVLQMTVRAACLLCLLELTFRDGQAADRVKCIKTIMKFHKLQLKSMTDIKKGIRKWYDERMFYSSSSSSSKSFKKRTPCTYMARNSAWRAHFRVPR